MQRIDPLLPQRPVVGEPCVDLGEWFGPQAVDATLRLLVHLDQPGIPKHPQVPRDPWAGDRQRVGEFTCRDRLMTQELKHGATVRVRQGVQNSVHISNVTEWVRTRKGTEADRRSEIGFVPARQSDAHTFQRTANAEGDGGAWSWGRRLEFATARRRR